MNMGGPQMAPQTPPPSPRPGEAVARLYYNLGRSQSRTEPGP